MVNFIKKVVKSIIYGAFLLYIYNLIGLQFGLVIPINIATILIVGFLGLPGLASLVLLLLLAF